MKKKCLICNKDISHRHYNSIYCTECAREVTNKKRKKYHRKYMNDPKIKQREFKRNRLNYLKRRKKLLEIRYVQKGMPNYLKIEIKCLEGEIQDQKDLIKNSKNNI